MRLDHGGLDASALHLAADRIASTHAAAPAGDGARFLAALHDMAGCEAQREELARQLPALDRRARSGRVRALGGVAVDCLFDLALPLMELLRDGNAVEANALANRYLDVAPQGATGWATLPLFVSLRASGAGNQALATAVLRPAPSRAVAIGGLSGTGKSTLGRLLGARLGRAPGARVLRSDVFRKRLMGLPPETRLPPRHYTQRSDQESYEALFESADDHLACGSAVILDAVFMRRSERDVAEAMALHHRIPFTGLWLEAPERDRVARVSARTGDASDATAEVVREQSRRSVGELASWHRMRVNRPIDLIVPAARAVLERQR